MANSKFKNVWRSLNLAWTLPVDPAQGWSAGGGQGWKLAAVTLALFLGVAAPPSQATTMFLSTTSSATLFGLSFNDKDVAAIDLANAAASAYFRASDPSPVLSSPGDTDINALHVRSDGSFIFSVRSSNSSIAGLSFNDDDLVRYDPATNTATKIFDGTAILADTKNADGSQIDEDVDAVFLRSNGNLVFSTTNDNVLGGISFKDDDIIEYNPITGVTTKIFDGTAILTDTKNADGSQIDEDVDAVHLLSSGEILFSTTHPGSFKPAFGGGLAFDDGDVVLYNPVANTASIFFDHNLFTTTGEDVNGFSLVPEPATLALLTAGLAGLGARRGRRRDA